MARRYVTHPERSRFRILIDTGRNGYSATFAAAYAVRPRNGAPVSAPATWEEVESGTIGPATFTIKMMEKRIADAGDLWSALFVERQSLREPMEMLASSRV